MIRGKKVIGVVAVLGAGAAILASCNGSDVELSPMPSAGTYTIDVHDGDAIVEGVDLDNARVTPTARLDADGDNISVSAVVGQWSDGRMLSYATKDNKPTRFVVLNRAGTEVRPIKARIDSGLAASDGKVLAYLTPGAGAAGKSTITVARLDGKVLRKVSLDFAPSFLTAGPSQFVAAGWAAGTLYAAAFDASTGETRSRQVKAGRPLALAWEGESIVALVRGGSDETLRGGGLPLDLRAAAAHSNVGAIAGDYVAFDDERDGSQVVSIARGGKVTGSARSDARGSLQGVSVSRTGHAAALFANEVVFVSPDGQSSSQELVGEARTYW